MQPYKYIRTGQLRLSSATLPMAQLDASSDRAAADGHIHVIDMPQLDASHGRCHMLDRAGPPDTSGRSHVVIDIDAGDGGSSTTGSDDAPCCAVCMEPLEWVAVGPCGHRVVCPECAARIRCACGPRRSKLCCICRALCPSVVVTNAASGGAVTFSTLPAASSQDGRVGEYWYFAAMSAYFDDEQQYKAAKAVAATITHLKPPPPPSSPAADYGANGGGSGGGEDIVNAQSFAIYLIVSAMFGASYGFVFATEAVEATGWGARAAIVSGAVVLTLAIACALWYMNYNTFCGPREDDDHIAL